MTSVTRLTFSVEYSFGTRGKKNPSANTRNTLTISRIFSGSMIRNSWLLPGLWSPLWTQSIPDFLFSGDGTLSVMDVRSKKPEPFAHSEDQEDELLCIAPIKGCA